MVLFSINVGVFPMMFDEPLTKAIPRMADIGYDAVEIHGEPDEINTAELKEMLETYDLESSVCGLYWMHKQRDLTNASKEIRRHALQYIKNCAKMAYEIGANILIVIPTSIFKTKAESTFEKAWSWAVEGLREAGKFAANLEVKLAVEPLNRYETYFINTIEQGLQMIEEVALDNVKIMADAFHMNIEEKNPANAIRNAGKNILHFHVADSNREGPGRGHTDFKSIFDALKAIEYQGYLTIEVFKGLYPEEGLTYMELLWNQR